MTRRTRVAYAAVLSYVQREVCVLHVRSFMADYEVPMRQAIMAAFPNAVPRMCWFHFKKAVRMSVSSRPRIKEMCATIEACSRVYQQLKALVLLPASMMVSTYVKLKAEVQEHPEFVEWMESYFERQWLRGVSVAKRILLFWFDLLKLFY